MVFIANKQSETMKLPVIVGFGGINAAGRSSGHHSYKRLLADVLPETEMQSTWQDLAQRMGLLETQQLTPDFNSSGAPRHLDSPHSICARAAITKEA